MGLWHNGHMLRNGLIYIFLKGNYIFFQKSRNYLHLIYRLSHNLGLRNHTPKKQIPDPKENNRQEMGSLTLK